MATTPSSPVLVHRGRGLPPSGTPAWTHQGLGVTLLRVPEVLAFAFGRYARLRETYRRHHMYICQPPSLCATVYNS